MHYADLYYALAFGKYPYETQEPYEQTCLNIQRLIDNGYTDREIEEAIERAAERRDVVFNKEHDWTRSDNLIKSYTFYYHPELQLTSPAPKFDPMTGVTVTTPFYLENKMIYSVHQLSDYIASKIKIPYELRDISKETGAVEYLLKKYSKVGIVDALDFVLFLADEAGNEDRVFTNVLDIAQYDVTVLDKVKHATAEAAAKGANKVIWRTIG